MKRARRMSLIALAVVAVMAAASAVWIPRGLQAAPSAALLTGSVKSASGEKLGGVTVSAKMEGSTITTTVFTDD
jgi:hypothetical protein